MVFAITINYSYLFLFISDEMIMIAFVRTIDRVARL